MLVNANPRSDVLPVAQDRTVREIEALCARHEVPCGAPQDLATLLHALSENKLLAMEFWSLIARATDRNHAAATDGSLLAAIVQAVAGQTLAEANSAGSMERLLVHKFANMLAGEDIQAPIAPGPFAAARDISPPASTPQPGPVPPPNPLPPRGQQLRLVLDPEPQSAAPGNHTSEDTRPFVIPLSAYADADDNRGVLPRMLAVVLLLAIIGGGWFAVRNPSAWNRSDNAIHNVYASATEIWKAHTRTHTSTSPTQPAQPAADAQVQALPIQPATPPPVESVPAAPAAAASQPAPIATPLRAAPPPKQRDADIENDAPNNPQAVVPETLMRQNLVSSRVPVSAAAHGIVVLQATITSRGTVEHLRAIQGDPSLHRAAIEAASTWRYRPYLLNGTPVDVSTTISVDFAGID